MEIFVDVQVMVSLSQDHVRQLFLGYRPILDAMKTFAADPSLTEKSAIIPDLEVSTLKPNLQLKNNLCFLGTFNTEQVLFKLPTMCELQWRNLVVQT